MNTPASTNLPALRDMRGSSDADREAVATALYESIGPRVMRFGASHFGGDIDMAEELTAETFACVVIGLPFFEGHAQWSTWVMRIAMNVSAGFIRRRYRDAGETHVDSTIAGHDPTQSSVLQRDDITRMVRECITTLHPDHRTALSLLALDGLAPAEAADLLGVAEGTVWSRYARARLALAERLRARGFGPQDMPT